MSEKLYVRVIFYLEVLMYEQNTVFHLFQMNIYVPQLN